MGADLWQLIYPTSVLLFRDAVLIWPWYTVKMEVPIIPGICVFFFFRKITYKNWEKYQKKKTIIKKYSIDQYTMKMGRKLKVTKSEYS